MILEMYGDKRTSNIVVATASVFERNGEYQSSPELVITRQFSKQFEIFEIIAMLSLECGLSWVDGEYKPDIRKIVIEYTTM